MGKDSDDSVLTAIAPSRRRVLGTAGAILGAGAAAGAGGVVMGEPAIRVSSAQSGGYDQNADENGDGFSASSVSITSNAGEVEDITLQPNLTISWDGLNELPNKVVFTLKSNSTSGGSIDSEIGSEELGSPTQTLEGSDSFQFTSALSLLGNSGWQETDFEATDNDGQSNTTNGVKVQIIADLKTDATTYTDRASDTFSVTVTDQGAEFGNDSDNSGEGDGVGGSAGTGGSGDDDEEDSTDG